ncbi:MAG: HlyD family secretion protein [Planctomycetota bacterium]
MADVTPAKDNSAPFYRRKRILIPLSVIAIFLLAGFWFWYSEIRGFVSTDDAYVDSNRVALSSKISGRITRLVVDEGDRVRANQPLVYLDDSDLKALEAQYEAAVKQSESNAVLARVNKEKALADFNRAEPVFKNGSMSQEQFEHSRKSMEATQASYDIALAQVGVAKAQLNVGRTQLLNTVIVAPFDGVVAKKWAVPGDVVQPAQPIFSIYDDAHIWVTANLEETKLSKIRLDNPVEIIIDAYPRHNFTGRVSRLGSNTASQFSLIPPNNASGNFTKVTQRVPIKILFKGLPPAGNPDGIVLLPGMSAEIRIKTR